MLLEGQEHKCFELLAARLFLDSVRDLLAIVLGVGFLDVFEIDLRSLAAS